MHPDVLNDKRTNVMTIQGIFYTHPSTHARTHEPKLSDRNNCSLCRFPGQLHNLLCCFPQVVGHFQLEA